MSVVTDKLDVATLASMIDLGAVRANTSYTNVMTYADFAVKYRCKAVFVLSNFLQSLYRYREENQATFLIGGTVGFPSGGTTLSMKVSEAKEVVALHADEIDMTLNVGYILSGMFDEVKDEIKAVKDAIGSIPLKVILECHYLTDDLIVRAAELAVEAGAQWVKTGTGWAPTGATLENVALLKRTVGDVIRVKAAGGVKNLETLKKMVALGVERFGLGGGAQTIIDEMLRCEYNDSVKK